MYPEMPTGCPAKSWSIIQSMSSRSTVFCPVLLRIALVAAAVAANMTEAAIGVAVLVAVLGPHVVRVIRAARPHAGLVHNMGMHAHLRLRMGLGHVLAKVLVDVVPVFAVVAALGADRLDAPGSELCRQCMRKSTGV